LRLGGGWGEINFLTGEEGWGFEEKSTQNFLHSGKKKKKQPNFEKIKSFSIFSFRQKVRFIFEKGTKYTRNTQKTFRKTIDTIFFLFRFFSFFYEKSKVGRFSKTSIFAERRLRRANGPNSHEFSPFNHWK
jgi:hypothetical protein